MNSHTILRVVAVAALLAGTVAITAGVADAEPRNACTDLANKRRADANGELFKVYSEDQGGWEVSLGEPLPAPEGWGDATSGNERQPC